MGEEFQKIQDKGKLETLGAEDRGEHSTSKETPSLK